MIGYVTLGTKDLQRAASFYDEVLGLIGAKRLMDSEQFILWGTGFDQPGVAVGRPHDGNPATVGNGVMVALRVLDRSQVDALYQKALELGGSDEGPPGPRSDTFYAAYFRDLDGNKFNAFVMG